MNIILRFFLDGQDLIGTHLLRLVSMTCPPGHLHPGLHAVPQNTPRLLQVLLHELAQVEYT